ncbi:hypothetical protein LguiA_007064 [Lonicera macranthoides]
MWCSTRWCFAPSVLCYVHCDAVNFGSLTNFVRICHLNSIRLVLNILVGAQKEILNKTVTVIAWAILDADGMAFFSATDLTDASFLKLVQIFEEQNDLRNKIFEEVVGQDGHGWALCMGTGIRLAPKRARASSSSDKNLEVEIAQIREEAEEERNRHKEELE